MRVTAAPTDHAPVRPTVGYRIDDGDTSVVIAGDTVPCSGLDELCPGADLLVHTVVRRDLIEPLGLARLSDVLDYHSSVEDAARTAARNDVGTLLLTHLVPAPRPGAEGEWVALAQEHFGGTVVVAKDLLSLEVPRRRDEGPRRVPRSLRLLHGGAAPLLARAEPDVGA